VYYRTVELGLHAVLRTMPPPAPRRPPEAVTAVVFGSDHGLCGRFNEEMADYTRARLEEAAAGGAPRLVAVGARVAALLETGGLAPEATLRVPASAGRITATVRAILFTLDAWQTETCGQRFYLLHNRAVSGGHFHPTGVQLLPVNLQRRSPSGYQRESTRVRPLSDPTLRANAYQVRKVSAQGPATALLRRKSEAVIPSP
jgi:F-type H+-transporting ATPase subunit gamma